MADNDPRLPVEKGNYDKTAPVFAKGLVALLQPVVAECDERIQAVMYSQRELSKQLDVLSAELDRFMEVSRTPLIGAYIDKLLRAKERMIGINVMLGNIQLRLEALQRENSTLPPSKLPPINVPSSPAQPTEPKKTLLGVNQPQFLSSWISKAKALVPDAPPTTAPSTTTTTSTITSPPSPKPTASAPPTQKVIEQEKHEAPVAEVTPQKDDNDVTEEIKLDDEGEKEDTVDIKDDTKGEGETGN